MRVASDCQSFPDIYISQGSVATSLRCGGIFNDRFITCLLPSPTERILKWSTFRKVMGKSSTSCFFSRIALPLV